MTKYALLKDNSRSDAVRSFLSQLLAGKHVAAVLVSASTPYSSLPMPTLFTDPDLMETADPLAPVTPFNAARQAAGILKHPTGSLLAVVLRPCEQRALIELTKLKQCSLEGTLMIGIECMGRMENDEFLEQSAEYPDISNDFYRDENLQSKITQACSVCEHFQPNGADFVISLFGTPEDSVGIASETTSGKILLTDMGLSSADEPEERSLMADSLFKVRKTARDARFQETSDKINNIKKFQEIIANCLNCYNCRMACPVCYCKECVFMTDVFIHDPETLIRRSMKRGSVKLPADTSMFHLTRLAHMSHACVGCGQCSSVCPSSIPVSDIFRTVAAQVQELYDYEPGRDVDEPIPFLLYEEEKK